MVLLHVVTYSNQRMFWGGREGLGEMAACSPGPQEGWPGILMMQTAGCFAGFSACPLGDPKVEMGQEVMGLLADKSDSLVSFLASLTDLVEVYLPAARDRSKASLF